MFSANRKNPAHAAKTQTLVELEWCCHKVINDYDNIILMSTSDVDCHHINLLPIVGNLNIVVIVAVYIKWLLSLAS